MPTVDTLLPSPCPNGPAGLPVALRQFCHRGSGTLSYLLACRESSQALLVDPVLEDAPLYLGVIQEMGWRLAYVVDTHVHTDHITAAATLRAATGAAIAVGRRSRALGCDLMLDHGNQLELGCLRLDILHTPGHTPGCLTLSWHDRLFSGDCLLAGDCGSTDRPGGDAACLFDTISRIFLPMPDETLVYPAHIRAGRRLSCIGDERGSNPLFSGISRDEFVARRAAARAEPPAGATAMFAANLRCGATSDSLPQRKSA